MNAPAATNTIIVSKTEAVRLSSKGIGPFDAWVRHVPIRCSQAAFGVLSQTAEIVFKRDETSAAFLHDPMAPFEALVRISVHLPDALVVIHPASLKVSEENLENLVF